jgi:hypothetical protein
MIKMKHSIQKFKILEQELNFFIFRGVGIGSLLAKYHTLLYLDQNNTSSPFWNIGVIFRTTVYGLIIAPKFQKSNQKILFNKLNDRPHCNALIDPIYFEFRKLADIYSKSDSSNSIKVHITKHLNIIHFIQIFIFLLKYYKRILQCYKRNSFLVNNTNLFTTLYIQLIALTNWTDFFCKSSIKIIITDFDRDFVTAPMILAANKLGLNTVTLVHGVIDPPYAYIPVLAKQIWCWGQYQKDQFIKFNTDSEKIKIVGCPIAKIYKRHTRNLKNTKPTIGIGLNPTKYHENEMMISSLITNHFSKYFNWIIKLHPSMSKSSWMTYLMPDNFELYSHEEYKIGEFFDKIDLLIITTSGIGFEAIVNNIPVWIFRVLDENESNDKIMIKHAFCPDITKEKDLSNVMKMLYENSQEYIDSLLEIEQKFVLTRFYSTIDKDATDNTIRLIRNLLSNV